MSKDSSTGEWVWSMHRLCLCQWLCFFHRVILCTFFLYFPIYGRFKVGVLGLGSWIGFLGLGFQLMGFWACGVGPAGLFGVGYIKIEE